MIRSLVAVALIATAASGCDSCERSRLDIADASPAATTIADAAPINVTTLPAASVESRLNPDKLPAYAGPTGSVEGTVWVTGLPADDTPADFAKCPAAAAMYGKSFREGAPKTAEPGAPRPLADAFVVVTGYSGFFVREKEEAKELTIEGCGFAARSVTLTFGQRLEVKNLTREFWTPKLEPASQRVMMMAAPGGDAVKIYPKRWGLHQLLDQDRKYVSADLYVFLHPLHTATNLAGAFRIDGLPVGKLRVGTSHPRIASAEAGADVEIKPGLVAHVELTLENKGQKHAGADAGDVRR